VSPQDGSNYFITNGCKAVHIGSRRDKNWAHVHSAEVPGTYIIEKVEYDIRNILAVIMVMEAWRRTASSVISIYGNEAG
jgi:hypothetical protein